MAATKGIAPLNRKASKRRSKQIQARLEAHEKKQNNKVKVK